MKEDIIDYDQVLINHKAERKGSNIRPIKFKKAKNCIRVEE